MKRKSRTKNRCLLLIYILLSGYLVSCMSDKQKSTDTGVSDITEFAVNDEKIQQDQIVCLIEQQAQDIYQMWKKEWEHYEMNSYLLSQKYKVCRAAVGDLNGDEQEDMVIVLDLEPDLSEVTEESEIVPENTRETFILLRKNEKFDVIARNKGLVMGEEFGGVFGDPFANIMIEDGVLTISNYGGSSDRWGLDYSFIYYNNNLRLIKIASSSYSTLTASGVIDIYDYLSGTYEQYSESGMDEELSGLLLNYGTFDASESYINSSISVPLFDGIACLPQVGSYSYHEELLFEMECTAMEALNIVRQSYYADAAEQAILWTKEIKENYTKLLHYPTPNSYFKNQEGCLSYYGIRPYRNENGIFGAEHIIMWKPFNKLDNSEYYYVDAVTGELLEQNR